MPKLTDDRRTARRTEITQAAARCFEVKGFEAASMADIVKESGLSAGAIYVHFENKDDLIRQVMREALDDRADELDNIAERIPLPTPTELIHELVEGATRRKSSALRIHSWSACLRNPALVDLLRDFAGRRDAALAAYMRAWLIHQGVDAAEANRRSQPLAALVAALFQGFLMQTTLDPAQSMDQLLDAVALVDFTGNPRTPDAGGGGRGVGCGEMDA